MNTNKVIDIIQAYENDTLEFKPRDKPYEKSGKSVHGIRTVLGRLASGNIDKFRIVDEYTKFEDAIKAGKVVYYNANITQQTIKDLKHLEMVKSHFPAKFFSIKETVADPYQKYRDAMEDPLKVVEFYDIVSDNWYKIPAGSLFFKDYRYRIMQYVTFDKSDLKGLYKRDVVDKNLNLFPLSHINISIDEFNSVIPINGEWYTLQESFELLRFYDPDKTTFGEMPIFGKLVEVTE